MVLLQPEEGGGEEEGAHLAAAVVEDPGAPVGVLPLPHVLILVAGLPVELIEAEGVLGEMGGDPVQNDAHPRLVKLVDEVHQVVRGAEAAGSGEIASALIAPGVVQGVLGDGHELHMGKAHLLHIGHQVVGDAPVGEEFPLPGPPPGAQVDLINIQRPVVDGILFPVVQPGLVVPLVSPQLIELGGRTRPGLGVEGVGVGFEQHPAVLGLDRIFVGVIALEAGDEALPQAAPQGGHGVESMLPAVEVPHHRDLLGMGSPHPEDISPGPVPLLGVGAHELPGPDGRTRGVRPDHLVPVRRRSLRSIHMQTPHFFGNIIQIMVFSHILDCQSN